MTSQTICSAYGPIFKGDYDLIMAAGHDVARRRMEKAGRAKWSKADYNAACDKIDELTKAAAGRFPTALFAITAKLAAK